MSLTESRPLRYTAAFYLYVMQGIPAGFALTAMANYLAAAGLRPQVVGTFVAAVGLPWTVQFVWGPLIDRYQGSPMGRRRPWVMLAQTMACLASLGLLLVRDPVQDVALLTAAFFVHSVFASVQDASVDALLISVIPAAERGRVNAFMRGGMLFGTGVGAALLASVLRHGGFFQAALTQSLLLLTMTLATVFVRERPGDQLLPRLSRHPGPGARGTHWDDAPPAPEATSLRAIFAELFRGLSLHCTR